MLVDWLHLSVNGTSTYESIMQGGSWDGVRGALANLAEERARSGRPWLLELGVVLMRENNRDLVPLARLARSFGFDRVVYKDLWVSRPELRAESLRHDPELAIAIRREIEQARGLGVAIRCEPWPELSRFPGRLSREVRRHLVAPGRTRFLARLAWDRWHQRLRHRVGRLRCDAPWESAQIDERGDVLFCCAGETLIGNLAEAEFPAIWGGPVAEDYRDAIRRREPRSACRECKYLEGGRPSAYERL